MTAARVPASRTAVSSYDVVPVHVDFHPIRNTPLSAILYRFDRTKVSHGLQLRSLWIILTAAVS